MANCNSNRFFITIGIITLFAIATACSNNTNEKYEDWPQITSQQKPWTRWWWMGNTYDKPSITAQLEAFAQAGIGGVEITPIYEPMVTKNNRSIFYRLNGSTCSNTP